MLREILKLMNEGHSDPRSISKELKISMEQFNASVDTMVRLGYLEQVEGSSGTCGGSKLCINCRSAKEGHCSMLETRTYYITEKGHRAID